MEIDIRSEREREGKKKVKDASRFYLKFQKRAVQTSYESFATLRVFIEFHRTFGYITRFPVEISFATESFPCKYIFIKQRRKTNFSRVKKFEIKITR